MASIIIPSYNGKKLLARCLPSVIQAVEYDGRDHEIIVVDDGSDDDSVTFIRENFSKIKVIQFEKNYGFAIACNKGIQASQGDIVILLNNDVVVERDFIASLLKHFRDDKVFAVSAKTLVPNLGMVNHSVSVPILRYGLLNILRFDNDSRKCSEVCRIFYACAAAAAYSRKKFMSLGGFDTIYTPFYGEDVDISYRAWKQGWEVLYDPASVVYHYTPATISRIPLKQGGGTIFAKNGLLFVWKNFTDRRLILSHLFWLPIHLLRAMQAKNLAFIKGFMMALRQLSEVWERRKREKRQAILTDREVFECFHNSQVDTKHPSQ